jgi:hypothetical protein
MNVTLLQDEKYFFYFLRINSRYQIRSLQRKGGAWLNETASIDGSTRPEWSRPSSRGKFGRNPHGGWALVALASGDFQIRSGGGRSRNKKKPASARERSHLPGCLPRPSLPQRRGHPRDRATNTTTAGREEQEPGEKSKMSSVFSGDETAPFFGFLGAAAALVFSCAFPHPHPPLTVLPIKRFRTESCGFCWEILVFFRHPLPDLSLGHRGSARSGRAPPSDQLDPGCPGAGSTNPSARFGTIGGAGFEKATGFDCCL